jgi:hypothetical protein
MHIKAFFCTILQHTKFGAIRYVVGKDIFGAICILSCERKFLESAMFCTKINFVAMGYVVAKESFVCRDEGKFGKMKCVTPKVIY